MTAFSDLEDQVISDTGHQADHCSGVKVKHGTYDRSLRRYVVTAKWQTSRKDSPSISKTLWMKLPAAVAISDTLLLQLCGDEDGCQVTLAQKDWDIDAHGSKAHAEARGPFRFSIGQVKDGDRRRWHCTWQDGINWHG